MVDIRDLKSRDPLNGRVGSSPTPSTEKQRSGCEAFGEYVFRARVGLEGERGHLSSTTGRASRAEKFL